MSANYSTNVQCSSRFLHTCGELLLKITHFFPYFLHMIVWKLFLLLIMVLLLLQLHCSGSFLQENRKIFQMSDPPRRSNISLLPILINFKARKPWLTGNVLFDKFWPFLLKNFNFDQRKRPWNCQINKEF